MNSTVHKLRQLEERRLKRKSQAIQICLEAVKKNGMHLQHVKIQTPEICLEAVKINGSALEYVKDMTPELCLEAVKNHGASLQYIKKQTQTPEMCLEAVKNNGYALRFVKIELPIEFLLEKFFTTHDPDFKKWIETRTNWVEYHKKQLMDLLQP